MSTLSICIPAYNASGHIDRLLRSISRQTVPFDEVIIYDDCSSDNTADICRSYGFTVIKGDHNVGCSRGRNIMAAVSECEWVHFHDADDDICDNYSEVLRKYICKSSSDVILCGMDSVDRNGGNSYVVVHDAEMLKSDAIKYSIERWIPTICGAYKRLRFIECGGCDEDESILYAEDLAMHIKLAANGMSFDSIDDVLCTNYFTSGSMSSNSRRGVIHKMNLYYKYKYLWTLYPESFSLNLWSISLSMAHMGILGRSSKCATDAKKLIPCKPVVGDILFRNLVATNGSKIALCLYYIVMKSKNLLKS